MSSDGKETGGSAFPNGGEWANGHPEGGMTLRDYFAAKAMHAELSTSGANEESALALINAASMSGRTIEGHIAFNAYELADAMLAERSKL